jgi:hypothetical protein
MNSKRADGSGLLETKRSNGPILGIMSCLLSIVLGIFVIGYFYVMAWFGLGHFHTFGTVSISIIILPLLFGIGSFVRKEKMFGFPLLGSAIAIVALLILILMLMVNGM